MGKLHCRYIVISICAIAISQSQNSGTKAQSPTQSPIGSSTE
ncbi:MAG: hypothetical protein WA783_00595 [Phormidesmis sp.]